MSIIGTVFNALGGGLVKDVGEAIDRNVTSDEERLTLKKEIDAQIQSFEVAMQGQVTERWQADMASDSWLSKNVRPGVLIAVALAFVGVIVTGTIMPVPPPIVEAIQWGFSIVAGSYFGAREVGKGIINWGKRG